MAIQDPGIYSVHHVIVLQVLPAAMFIVVTRSARVLYVCMYTEALVKADHTVLEIGHYMTLFAMY